MKLDLGSFAFGSSVATGGNTPSWGTSLGQKKPDLKLTFPGCDNIIIGMMYKSIPIDKVFIPIGKGGHVCNSLEDEGIQLAALFDKVFVNEVRINAPFIMLIYRDSSDSWNGRRTLKYNVKIEYRKNDGTVISNSDFEPAVREALQLGENACWVISDICIVNQDELHFIAGIVNRNNAETYPTAELRKAAFMNAVKNTYDENPHFLSKYSEEKINEINDEKPITYSNQALQQIYYGAPGTGKSHIINKTTCGESVIRTTFHPDSDYSTFVGCYKPTTKTVKMRDLSGHVIKDDNGEELTEDRIVYEFVDQAFLQAYIQAWKFYDDKNEEIKKQFLVIEEINRGNCAQIFGDLFQLLDRNACGFSDYPIQADNDMRKQLAKAFKDITISEENKSRINACYKGGKDYVSQVLKGEILLLPDNLYIWATMNTSDQSLFPIDSAFKRRWDWQYMPIAKGRENGKDMNWSIVADENEYDWWSFLTKINEQIGSTTNSEDKKLGFFFCKAVNGKISAETFVGKVIFYLWNDVFKDFGFDNTIFNDEDGSTLSFDKFYATENGKVIVCKDKVELFLKNLGIDIISSTIDAEADESEEDEDGNSSSTSERDYTKYSINGVGSFGKNRLALECVKEYIKLHPDMPANEVIRKWKSLGYIVPHLIESKEEFEARTDNSKGRSSEIPCGPTVLYVVRNGFGRNRKVDVLIQKVNEKDWGIKVDKVE